MPSSFLMLYFANSKWSHPAITGLMILVSLIEPQCVFGNCIASGVTGNYQDVAAKTQDDKQETEEEQREKIAADRFLELLKKKPRLGTALDKVYGYHVGRGTLETFATQLETDANEAKDGNLWMIVGMVHMQRGQDALASLAFERAEKLLPKEPLVSYYLGKTLVLTGDVDKAAEALRRAIEKKPARPDMLQVFQDLGRIFQRTGRNEEALKVWSELEAMYPGDAGVQEQIATILAEEGADQAALDRYIALHQSLKDQFRKVEMGVRAAQLQAKLGQSEKALAEFEKLLATVNPDSWLYRDIRGRIEEVFWSTNDFDGLVQYYTEWSKKNPDDVDAMIRTARILSIQKRTPEALEWFKKAVERAPSNVNIRRALVETLEAEGEYGKAAEEMEQLVKLDSGNPDAIVRWGELVMAQESKPATERKQKAAEIWTRLLETRADDPVTVARLADLLRGADMGEAAIEQYRKAISFAQDEPQYREYLGEYLHQIGRKDEAIATWEELARGDRRTRDNLVRLSEVFSTFNLPEKALTTMAEACEMKPDFGQRVRYAELLRDATRYDDSLAQLELAEKLADDQQERELVISERIKNFQVTEKLAGEIEKLETAVADKSKSDGMDWRLLALFREANREFQPACDAIEQATTLSPADSIIWETAAGLYERTGRYGEASAAYRKLSTLDRRFLTNYLTQIASLEMRLGNVEEALAAGEELLEAAPGDSEHFRFFSDLCKQAGQVDRGLEMLRRNLRSNPNDADSLAYLAKSLSEEFQTGEAIELYWRAFDQAKDIDSKLPVIEMLTELYLRTDKFDTLIDRLSVISREASKTRDGLLWIAGAHQAAGDLGMARQMLEQLVREDSRDTKLLEQLVKLSKTEYDLETAIVYQKRLVAIAPTPEGEYALANLLIDAGDIDQAEGLWMKLSQRGKDRVSILSTINSLISKGQIETAQKLTEQAIQKEPENWELYGPALVIYVKSDQLDKAQEIANRVLAMKVAPETLSESTRKAREKAAKDGNKSRSAVGVEYFDSLANPTSVAQSVAQFQETSGLFADPYGYMSRRTGWSAGCFAHLIAVAEGMELVAIDDAKAREAFIAKKIETALEGTDRDLLWQAVRYPIWTQMTSRYVVQSSETARKNPAQPCIDKLVKLRDADAASMTFSTKLSKRMGNNGSMLNVKPMERIELEELINLSELAGTKLQDSRDFLKSMLVVELQNAGMHADADKLFSDLFKTELESYEKYVLVMSIIRLMPLTKKLDESKSDNFVKFRQALKAKAMEAINEANSKSQNVSYMPSQAAQLMPALADAWTIEELCDMVQAMLSLQARITAEMRPSQRDRSQSGSQPANYYQVIGNRGQETVVPFPPPTAYFNSNCITVLHSLFQTAKQSPENLAKMRSKFDDWAKTETNDPYLKFVQIMAKTSIEYWSDDRVSAMKSLEKLSPLNIGSQTFSLMQIRLKYDEGDIRGALDLVDALRPANQNMLVDRELTRLQLLLQLGDLEMSRNSAKKLFALRLSSDTEFKLAELMYQLGMKDFGDRMYDRIRRRAGGKQDTLARLMQSYASAGNMESACEIARQIVRRTKPPTSRNYRTAEDQQNEQALQILVRGKQIEPLIAQYEKLVERSPKALHLTMQLAAFYEAAGRREDARKLTLSKAGNSATDPQSLIAAGQALASAGEHSKAVDKYMEALRMSPEILNNSYYEMRTSLSAAKEWSKLLDVLVETGFDKFQLSYRMSEIAGDLTRADDFPAFNRLLRGMLEGNNLSGFSEAMDGIRYVGQSPETMKKVDSDLTTLLVDKLIETTSDPNRISYSNSRSTYGITTGSVNGFVNLISQNEAEAKRLTVGLEKQLVENPDFLFSRTTLCLLACAEKNFVRVDELLKPLLESKDKSQQVLKALWNVCSQMANEGQSPERAVAILESLDLNDEQAWGQSYMDQYGPDDLLVYACENSKQMEKAKTHLLRMLSEAKIDESQNQYNPGYGEYQYLNQMASLSMSLLKADCPVEAYIAYSRSLGNSEMVAKSSRWSGTTFESQGKRILKSIQAKLNDKLILKTVNRICKASDTLEDSVSFLSQVEYSGNSLSNSSVGIPLEIFAKKIKTNKELQASTEKILLELPSGTNPEFQQLLGRQVFGSSLENSKLNLATIDLWKKWLADNPAPDWANLKEEAKPKTGKADSKTNSKDDEEKTKTGNQDARGELINREISLAIAARLISAMAESDKALTEAMMKRAMDAAKAANKAAIRFDMQCQFAKSLATRDPQAAEAQFLDALNELLPPKTKEEKR